MHLLTPEILVSAYAQGIFPMGVDGLIRWFSPDPRAILPLERFHVSKTLRQTAGSGKLEIRINTSFLQVMQSCGDRPEGTWITPEIISAYVRLNECGFAHSVETWQEGRLVGGLYGVALQSAFFGESMFHCVRDASKVALVALVDRMMSRGYRLLDVQYQTPHLKRFGSIEIPRCEYLSQLACAMEQPCTFEDS